MIAGNSFTLRGPSGEFRCGWHQAAVLGDWTITGPHLTATVVSQNEVWMSQPSLTFRVVRPNAAPWVWTVDSLQLANGTVTARVKE
jgi:hypothetical protein